MKQTLVKKFTLFSHLLSSIYFLISRMVAPRSRREDHARREYILNIILLASLALSGVFSFFTLINSITVPNYKGISFLVAFGIFAVFLLLYILSRVGYFILASYLLLLLYFLPTSYALYRWGIYLEVPLISYVLIIVVSGILISSWCAFVMTGVISATILLFGYWDARGVHVPDVSWRDDPTQLSYAIELAVIYFVIMVVTWLYTREIEKSLKRARRSESLLQAERDTLESRVEERTRELKRVQLEQMKQLHQFAEMGKMSSGFFHDLVSPLTAVSLDIEQLKKGAQTDVAMVKAKVDRAFDAVGRLEQFIRSIQKQIQNQETKSYFSLAEEIQQAIDVLGYKARRGQVELIFKDSNEIYSWGNPIKFYQLALNLISNAIDAYDGIERDLKKVEIKLSYQNNTIHFLVSDMGGGMAPETVKHIFDPLFTTKVAEKGTGIGLLTVKNVVEKELRGTIQVESSLGHGAIFSIVFPKVEPEPSA